jgi:hypothetical protein
MRWHAYDILVGPPAGEGGAGTWSDGKLTTKIGRNSDPVRRVLQALHLFGAPEVGGWVGRVRSGCDDVHE